jgi:hypothetical protein
MAHTTLHQRRYDILVGGRVHTRALSEAQLRDVLSELSFAPSPLIRKLKAKGSIIITDDCGPIRIQERRP